MNLAVSCNAFECLLHIAAPFRVPIANYCLSSSLILYLGPTTTVICTSDRPIKPSDHRAGELSEKKPSGDTARSTPANNVDAETLLGNLQFEYDRSHPAVPKGVARLTWPLRSRAAKDFRHCAQIFFPWPVEDERVSQTLSPYNALGRRPSDQPRTRYYRWCFAMRTRR